MMNNTFVDSLESRRLLAVDLAVASIQINSYDASSGTLTVQASISNFGSSDDPPTGVGAFVLSKDQVINNGDDIKIDTVDPSLLPRISQQDITRTIHIPGTTPAGDYYVGIALDINNAVPELDEGNNFMFTDTTIHIPKLFAVSIQGTAGDDKISMGVTNNQLQIAVNKVVQTYPVNRVGSIAVDGGAGNDVIFADPTMTIPVYFYGGDGNDALGGTAANDTLSGGAGKDTIRGAGGHDRINGNGGNDQLFGEDGPDVLYGGAGNDMLDGGSSGDHLDGGDGSDTVYGQGGNDTMTANDGSTDYLYGGGGTDVATADAGDIRSSVTLLG
jgi:Ca2+-binding RTX toxin-like protein